MPGGALTSNTQMLRKMKMFHKYPKILANMSECVRRGGFGTSVTPVSQFYFQQAFNNVIYGDWKRIHRRYGKRSWATSARRPCRQTRRSSPLRKQLNSNPPPRTRGS